MYCDTKTKWYICFVSSTSIQCNITSTIYEGLHGLQIDNPGTDAVEIEQIKLYNGYNTFIYDNF